MIRFSTGLRNALATQYGLGILMDGGIIRVYNGVIPSSPDKPPLGVELGRITTEAKTFNPGNDIANAGLRLLFMSPGILVQAGDWKLKGLSSGTATWWRWNWSGPDSNHESSLYPRVDGLIGSIGQENKELLLVTTAMTSQTLVTIENFVVVLNLEHS
ncbi:MAG: hypothetical protein KC589_10400 [Nanoarchaeota archaeon]|nr:hypothetical protein [Nanoarchaeota archaeon]